MAKKIRGAQALNADLRLRAFRPEFYSLLCDRWNHELPIGIRVRYYPAVRSGGSLAGKYYLSRTTTRAWQLGDGHPVVKLEGIPGCISLFHLRYYFSLREQRERSAKAKEMSDGQCIDH